MDKIKKLIDFFSPSTPPPAMEEAYKDNIKFDQGKLDGSISRLLAAKDEFHNIVSQVVIDLKLERRQSRNAKTSPRARKT